jgi:hypothetical protein
VHLAAGAPCPVQVVLDPAGGRLGDLQLLIRAGHPQAARAGQVRAAAAQPLRIVADHLVRLGPAHRRPWRARLLAALTRRPLRARRCCRDGGFRPGRSSAPGGMEEFPLLRDAARSSRATRSCSSLISLACSASTLSRAARAAQSGPGGGRSVTTDHDQSRPSVSKPTRWADSEEITRQPSPSPAVTKNQGQGAG